MSLFIGIIGLPNAGKSTLFNALTEGHAPASAYPFCTVDPNVGVVAVPDPRLDRLAVLLRPESTVAAQIRFVDIAGLVRGASRGEGLGNRFLAHIREADALVHVVRCFDDRDVSHVEGSIDPLRDIATIETELMLADLETATSARDRVEKVLKADPRGPERPAADVLSVIAERLAREVPVHGQALTEDRWAAAAPFHFLTAKPVLYVANVGEGDLPGGGPRAEALARRVGAEGVLPVCAEIEGEIAQLPPEDRAAFLSDYGLAQTGIDRLIAAGVRLLGLITFYTTAHGKLQAWHVTGGTTAPRAAGKVHSAMERGFIRAEVAHCADVEDAGGTDGLREAGKLRAEGKDYVIRDGDVVRFLFREA